MGDGLKTPFEALSGSGQRLADVGTSVGRHGGHRGADARDRGGRAAPILIALLVWAFFRIRFVRRATAASRLVGTAGSLELFALRALTRQPLRRLRRWVRTWPGRFRDGDPVVVHQLAALELARAA